MTGSKPPTVKAPDAFEPTIVSLGKIRRLGDGFRPYERHEFTMRTPDGDTLQLDRDVVRCGSVVGILPVDIAAGRVVLIRQFRLAALLATGVGDIVELAAGRVDAGETPDVAAARECREEIGVTPQRLSHLLNLMPAPAFSDEVMSLWVAAIDSHSVPPWTGEADEHEFIRPWVVSFDDALSVLRDPTPGSAPLIIALQWLAANRSRLTEVLR